MLFSPQLPLPLEPRRTGGLDDFVAGPNGPVRSGKTHLLNGACLAARDGGRTAFYLALRRLDANDTASLQGLETTDLVCIDDLDAVAGSAPWEEALFHLHGQGRLAGAGQAG